MTTINSPATQKEKLQQQMQTLQRKIAQFDKRRKAKIGRMASAQAFKQNILHVPDPMIQQALQDAFKRLQAEHVQPIHPTKKNSSHSTSVVSDDFNN